MIGEEYEEEYEIKWNAKKRRNRHNPAEISQTSFVVRYDVIKILKLVKFFIKKSINRITEERKEKLENEKKSGYFFSINYCCYYCLLLSFLLFFYLFISLVLVPKRRRLGFRPESPSN